MLQSILESSCHGLNRFQVYKEEKTLLDGRKGDPKKVKFLPFFFETPPNSLDLRPKKLLRSILESSYHGLNRFLVDLEEKKSLMV